MEVMQINDKYIERFFEPEITAQEFLKLFISVSYLKDYTFFDKVNLQEYIQYCKENRLFTDILQDINFKSNGVFSYSEEYEEAITKLKLGGITYTVSPEMDNNIYIDLELEVGPLVKPAIDYLDMVVEFFREYNKYLVDKINKDEKVRKYDFFEV